MTTFFLVRHAVHELGPDILAGRSDVGLSDEGRDQARRLARRLSSRGLTDVQSSPRARTRQTAEAIAEATGLDIAVIEEADEIDFGEWTGKSFAELDADPRWLVWNGARGTAATPAGEAIRDVERRITGHMGAMRDLKPEARIAIVSHAEVIRTAVLHYLGIAFDSYDRLEIAPASMTTLVVGTWGARLTGLNEREI